GAYDQVLLSCPGTSQPAPKPPGSTTAMYDYAAAGGRILAEHPHSEWLSAGPPDLQAVATFYDTTTSIPTLDAHVDMSTPRGVALSEWLMAAGASTVAGRIQIRPATQTVVGLGQQAERIVLSNTAASAQVFAITTPPSAPAKERCGRLVYTDSHTALGGSG